MPAQHVHVTAHGGGRQYACRRRRGTATRPDAVIVALVEEQAGPVVKVPGMAWRGAQRFFDVYWDE